MMMCRLLQETTDELGRFAWTFYMFVTEDIVSGNKQ